jgi:branched-chain amino acid transport system permease protein
MIWIFGQQLWNGFVAGMAYDLFGLGLTLIFGIMGVINMAHGEMYMLGAMLLWTITTYLHVGFFLAMVVACALVGIFAIFFNRVAIQPLITAPPLSTMLSTMAVSSIIMYGSLVVWNVDSRNIETPFQGTDLLFGIAFSRVASVLCFVGTGSIAGTYFFLKKTVTGRSMIAVAQDKLGAAVVGINVEWVYGAAVVLCACLASIGGEIIGPIWVAHPEMGQEMLLKGFAIVIIGGMGNIIGCTITGIALGVLEAIFSQLVSVYYRDVFAFSLMVLVCLLRPQGLFTRR